MYDARNKLDARLLMLGIANSNPYAIPRHKNDTLANTIKGVCLVLAAGFAIGLLYAKSEYEANKAHIEETDKKDLNKR
jgi:hypothetical protein